MERTKSNVIIPGQRGPGSDGNKRVLRIPQSSGITGASTSNCLVSYLEHSLGESYPSAEMHSEYFTASADLAKHQVVNK